MLNRLLPALTGIWIMLCGVLPFYPFEPANRGLQAHPSVIAFGALASIFAVFMMFYPHSSRRIDLMVACSWIGMGVTLMVANVVIAGGITIILGASYTLDYLRHARGVIPNPPVDNYPEPCEDTGDKSQFPF